MLKAVLLPPFCRGGASLGPYSTHAFSLLRALTTWRKGLSITADNVTACCCNKHSYFGHTKAWKSEGRRRSLVKPGFIFVNRRATAVEILRRVQRVSEREILVLYHSTQKLRQSANL